MTDTWAKGGLSQVPLSLLDSIPVGSQEDGPELRTYMPRAPGVSGRKLDVGWEHAKTQPETLPSFKDPKSLPDFLQSYKFQ